VVDGYQPKAIAQWSARYIKPDTIVILDSLAFFLVLVSEDKHHFQAVTGGHYDMVEDPAFKWVNTVIENVKTRHGAFSTPLA